MQLLDDGPRIFFNDTHEYFLYMLCVPYVPEDFQVRFSFIKLLVFAGSPRAQVNYPAISAAPSKLVRVVVGANNQRTTTKAMTYARRKSSTRPPTSLTAANVSSGQDVDFIVLQIFYSNCNGGSQNHSNI